MKLSYSSPPSLKIRLARIFASIFRFGGLRLAKLTFDNAGKQGKVIPTRMFGGVLPVLVERSNTHKLVALEGERFIEERQIVSELVNPGDIVVDVGANIGYYTLLFNQKVGPHGKVIAVEPEPHNLIELRRTIETNRLSNVTIVSFALGDEDKDVSLAEGVNGMISDATTDTITVQQRQLDTLLANLKVDTISVIKIDIEGHEWHALQGMKNVLNSARPRLFIEVHPAMLPNAIKASDIVSLLSEGYADFRVYVSCKRASFSQRLRKRYRGYTSSEFLPKHQLPAFLAAADAGKIDDPFWLVCRNE